MAINRDKNNAKRSEQNVLNSSYDEDFDIVAFENLTYNPVTRQLERETKIQGNASTVISFNAAGECIKIEKTIGSTTYTKLFTRSDNVIASTLPISAWS